MVRTTLASLLMIAALSLSVLAEGNKVEAIGALTDSTVSEVIRGAMEAKGYRVTAADGSVLCEIWLRNGVPLQEKKDVSGATYTELGDANLIGVISLAKAGTDFRGQPVKPGAYTLRYALHPTDGNHMGISPYRDFLLLIPAPSDPDLNTKYKFEELTKLSAKSAGTNHPAGLSLLAPEAKSFPAVSENDQGHLVFTAKLKTQAGAEIPIAFIVKGVMQQ